MSGETYGGDEYEIPDGNLNEKAAFWNSALENVVSTEDPVLKHIIDDMSGALEDAGFAVNQGCYISGSAVWVAPIGADAGIDSPNAESIEKNGVSHYRGDVSLAGGALRTISIAKFSESEPMNVWFTFCIGKEELESSTVMFSDEREYLMHVQASTVQIVPAELFHGMFDDTRRVLTEEEQAVCDTDLHVLSREFNEHEDDHDYKMLPLVRKSDSDWEFIKYAESEVPVRDMHAAIAAQHALVATTFEGITRYEHIDVRNTVFIGLCLALQPIDKRYIPFVDYSALNPRELCLTAELQVDLEQDEEVVLPAKSIVHLPLFSQKVAILPRS